MADAKVSLPEVSSSTVISVIVAVVILIVLYLIYLKFWGTPAKPAGALTDTEYNALSATDKALYKKDANNVYWIKG